MTNLYANGLKSTGCITVVENPDARSHSAGEPVKGSLHTGALLQPSVEEFSNLIERYFIKIIVQVTVICIGYYQHLFVVAVQFFESGLAKIE